MGSSLFVDDADAGLGYTGRSHNGIGPTRVRNATEVTGSDDGNHRSSTGHAVRGKKPGDAVRMRGTLPVWHEHPGVPQHRRIARGLALRCARGAG